MELCAPAMYDDPLVVVAIDGGRLVRVLALAGANVPSRSRRETVQKLRGKLVEPYRWGLPVTPAAKHNR